MQGTATAATALIAIAGRVAGIPARRLVARNPKAGSLSESNSREVVQPKATIKLLQTPASSLPRNWQVQPGASRATLPIRRAYRPGSPRGIASVRVDGRTQGGDGAGNASSEAPDDSSMGMRA